MNTTSISNQQLTSAGDPTNGGIFTNPFNSTGNSPYNIPAVQQTGINISPYINTQQTTLGGFTYYDYNSNLSEYTEVIKYLKYIGLILGIDIMDFEDFKNLSDSDFKNLIRKIKLKKLLDII